MEIPEGKTNEVAMFPTDATLAPKTLGFAKDVAASEVGWAIEEEAPGDLESRPGRLRCSAARHTYDQGRRAWSITALAIVAIPLFGGELPSSGLWLLATTAVACGLTADARERGATGLALVAIMPCLLLGWTATALVHAVHTDFPFHDTVAALAPLPVTGGALLGALLLAATRWRTPSRRLAHVGVAVIAAGTGATSLGFFLLGLRGLPRRYLAYFPEFQSLQIVVGAAAVVTVVGCVLALEALRRGTRVEDSTVTAP